VYVEGIEGAIPRSGNGRRKSKMEENKVEGVLKWLTPQCMQNISQLTRKDEKWKWGDKQ